MAATRQRGNALDARTEAAEGKSAPDARGDAETEAGAATQRADAAG
jgi:hypothetical protein